jgi:hypothetical protein
MAVKAKLKLKKSPARGNGRVKLAKKKVLPQRKSLARNTATRFKATRLKILRPVPSDIEIAQAGKLKPILQIAEELGIRPNELELYGPYKAKVKLEILERLMKRPNGKYIDVTAITPTPLGEGKTTQRSACHRHWVPTSASGSLLPSGNHPKAPRSASRAARQAADIRR